MARRHDIPNLERRGHTFYWRARVPVRFRRMPRQARLSFSLRLSDHRKAIYMAQRLNTLLADLTVRPTAAMTTKDQLEQIFRSEIERMNTYLEDIAFAARRAGTTDDVREMEADIEVGWAYRLIQLYGTMRHLSFAKDCPGTILLKRHGIPEPHIPFIAETFRAEQKGAAGQVFDREVRQQMADVGLPDTMANRERAKMEIFRAKADALLNVAERWPMIDRHQNAFVASTLPEEERPSFEAEDNVDEDDPDGANRVQSVSCGASADVAPSAEVAVLADQPSAISANELGALASERVTAHETSSEIISPPAEARATASANDAQDHVLSVADFDQEYEKLERNNRENWEPSTASDVRALIRIFADILDEHGVRHSGEIRQTHIAALRDHFNLIPPRYGQSARLRKLRPAALRAYAVEVAERAERTGKPAPIIGLSNTTIRKHLGNLDTFLKHLRANGYAVADWNLAHLRPRKPKAGAIRQKQQKPSAEQVRPIFDLPIFTGCADAYCPAEPGNEVFHSSLYFMPMLLVYLGLRRNEIAGMRVDDVLRTEYGPALHIRPNELRRVKTVQSDRLLPIPNEVVRLGILDYTDALSKIGHDYLFPELYAPHHKTNDPGDRFYKDFVPLLRAAPTIGDNLWSRAIHALRHGFANTLKQAGVDEALNEDIAGRLGTSETSTRYTDAAGLALVREAIAKYPNVTEHLLPRPIKLLPWVESKSSPPWAGKQPKDRFKTRGK